MPIITIFSWACRIDSTKELTFKQRDLIDEWRHLPELVRNGSQAQAPSAASDKFSFGLILRTFSCHISKGSKELSKDLSETFGLLFIAAFLKVYLDTYFSDHEILI